MSHNHTLHGVVPIHGAYATVIGTGVVVGRGLIVTALHVVDPEPAHGVHVDGLEVTAIASIPLRCYGPQRHLASISYHRDRILTGNDLGTVDLALLAVPGLDRCPLSLRHSPVQEGENIKVAGYPAGEPGVTVGPVSSRDDANFVVKVALSTGNSGSPAIDDDGRLAGLAVLDHEDAGAIFIGPELITSFIRRSAPLLHRVLPPGNGLPDT